MLETELGSSLGLQVCLYYNAVFTLPWLAGLIAVTAANVCLYVCMCARPFDNDHYH